MDAHHTDHLLRLEHVAITDRTSGSVLVDNVSFSLRRGQCLGIVGESGSGKTLLCRAIMGLLPPALRAEGHIFFEETDMLHAAAPLVRRVRGLGISAILQQAMTAFDPLYTIGAQFREIFQEKLSLTPGEACREAAAALRRVNLPETLLKSYPHQLSGGMLQRCMIAVSLALRSRLVIADEPATALDAHNQHAVLQRLARMRQRHGTALILVSHDLGAVQLLADRVMVLRKGVCVEEGSAADIFHAPRHEYTRHLVRTRLALTRAFERLVGGRHDADW